MFLFYEAHKDDTGLFFRAKRVWTYHSHFQDILVLETETWGRVLVLDGLVQLTDRDAFIYHELLAHVPLMTARKRNHVLIVGGGDGGTLREVLKHPVEKVTLCEIDPMVIEVAKKHWPELKDVFTDKRVQVVTQDGFDFLRETDEKFDIILVDSSDPVSHSRSLFIDDFVHLIAHHLHDDGVYTTQCLSPFYSLDFIKPFMMRLPASFTQVVYYHGHVPAYPGGWWGFVLATKFGDYTPWESPNLNEASLPDTRYWTPEIHKSAFILPKFIQEELKNVQHHSHS